MSQQVNSYVNVCIWRAQDKYGHITTSSAGWRDGNSHLGRVGHGAIYLVKDGNPTYMSFWPESANKLIGNKKSVCVEDINRDIYKRDGTFNLGKPDIMVRLYHLNIDEMLRAYQIIKQRSEKGELFWNARVTDTEDATNPKCKKASCVSFVWTILRHGGIEDKTKPYHKFSRKGPKDKDFFNLLKCNLGQRAGGFFDDWFWTKKVFTPYALSLRVGSAAEATKEDKEATITLMSRADQVAKIEKNPIGAAPPDPGTPMAVAYHDTVEAPDPNEEDEGMSSNVIVAALAVAVIAVIAINQAKKE